MTPFPTAVSIAAVIFFILLLFPPPPSAHAFGGSASTISISYGSSITICCIVAQQPTQYIQCWKNGQLSPQFFPLSVSFDSISGGLDILCAIRSGGSTLLCWNTRNFTARRLYFNISNPLTSVTIGDTQICALTNGTINGNCWRGNSVRNSTTFRVISSGLGFSCGVLLDSKRIVCWGSSNEFDDIALDIQSGFSNISMLNIFVGGKHACGLNSSGFLICKGNNRNGQLNVPSNHSFEYSSLALGANHSCGIRRLNNTVICWGGGNGGIFSSKLISNISFESIVAGLDFTCGLVSNNFSIVCWGPGWPENLYPAGVSLPLPAALAGQCVQSSCKCGIYPESQRLCFGNGIICRPCDLQILSPPLYPSAPRPSIRSPSPRSPASPSRGVRKGLFAFAIVGSVGGLAGICTVIYCLWTGVCLGKKKVHNSVQPTITTTNLPQQSNSGPPSRSSTLRRQGSMMLIRRQRSGTSSKHHTERAEEFLFHDLALATDNFSMDNKIGAGSFGVVYKGKLLDGREVAIKRSENGPKTKKFQEKESAFDSELAFLSRLHHKHLVRLVGFCEENEERLLVYEYMKHGALFDHLHDEKNIEKSSSVVNSWKMRIKISLDAARGIEYLHNYAVPPIIHRDIKSSNILLDANWTARVSDFGLSLMSTDSDRDFRPALKAAGTVGYIDPEAYSLNVLTAKSDVYGLGVVLLELLTGKRAIFKLDEDQQNGGEPTSVVEYAVPQIMSGELAKILDSRVGPPELNESEAVELVAYTALHCVNLEGKDRPTMADIVANLERAFALCEDSLSSISSDPISIVSE